MSIWSTCKKRFGVQRALPKRALDYVNTNVDKKMKWGIEKWNEKIMKNAQHAVEIIQKEMKRIQQCVNIIVIRRVLKHVIIRVVSMIYLLNILS